MSHLVTINTESLLADLQYVSLLPYSPALRFAMSGSVYVDASAGIDSPGRGSVGAPFNTAGYALFISESISTIFVRNKDAEYIEITASAMKKAKKEADGLAKKAKKEEELKHKEEEKKANELRKLEESKKIVITEDSTLPRPIKVDYPSYSRLMI